MTRPGAPVCTAAIILSLAYCELVPAQSAYPQKTVRLISPFPAGGGNDILSRLLAQKFTESWGQQVIVENRPGGNTVIASEALVKSPPDGYTILCAGSAHVLVPLVMPTRFSPNDFAPISTFAKGELILVLHPSVPANTVRDLIALAKSRPGQLNYATYGTATTSHLGMELFSLLAGVKMQHIPYKGGAPAITDLLGGQVDMYLSVVPSVIAHLRSSRLKAVAVSGEGRLPVLPQVPTFTEAGLPGVDVKTWHSVLAPAGTPKDIIDKISTEIARVVGLPDVQAKMAAQGVQPFYTPTEQFAVLLQADRERYSKIIKAANIKFDN
jgi:tripartite-type tricarboxylate transporter receptor subunit TctC